MVVVFYLKYNFLKIYGFPPPFRFFLPQWIGSFLSIPKACIFPSCCTRHLGPARFPSSGLSSLVNAQAREATGQGFTVPGEVKRGWSHFLTNWIQVCIVNSQLTKINFSMCFFDCFQINPKTHVLPHINAT